MVQRVNNTRAHARTYAQAPKHTRAYTIGCQLKITFLDAFEYYEQQLPADCVGRRRRAAGQLLSVT